MSCKSKGPGPGAYVLPPTVGFNRHDVRKQRRPQYSFGTQYQDQGKAIGPGPGAYYLEKVNRYGNEGTPKYSLHARTGLTERSRGPGPAAHNVREKPCFKGTRAPAYSLLGKNYSITAKVVSPPPNTYMVNVQSIKQAAPKFSMGMGLQAKLNTRSPGPATYGRTNLNVKLQKSPEFSLAERNNYAFKTCSPGPNAYNMAYYRPGISGPKYSFGVKHADWAPPMVVACDNS